MISESARLATSLFAVAALFSAASFASGVYLSAISAGPISEGSFARVAWGTSYAEVRAYRISAITDFAACSGSGDARTCGACPLLAESASFIITWMNGTQSTVEALSEGATYESNRSFKLKAVQINETLYVENRDSGMCAFSEAKVNIQLQPYVGCSTDSHCDSGYGCVDNTCVRSECVTNANCAADEYCVGRQCYTVPQGTCGEVSNHTWKAYACCQNSDCMPESECINHGCRTHRLCFYSTDCTIDEICNSTLGRCQYFEPGSSCGAYSSHAWVNYSCCNNSMCASGRICTADHVCVGCGSDADCPEDSECQSGGCVKITGCGSVTNHTLHPYACCADSDCFEEFACTNHECRPVPCECGEITNHACACSATPTPSPAASATPPPTPGPSGEPAENETSTPVPRPRSESCAPAALFFAAFALAAFAKARASQA